MTENAKVDVIIKGKDQASGQMKKIGTSTDQMATKFRNAGTAMTVMGVAMLVGLAKMTSSYAKAGDEIAKMSRRTGISTEALSEMRHIAEISGTSLSAFEKSIKKMQRTIYDASTGQAEYVDTFEALGVAMEDIVGKTPEEQFWILRDALAEVDDFSTKAALAAEVFGRSGTDLMPIIDDTAESIQELKQETHDLNQVWDEEAALASEGYMDAMANLKGAFGGIKNQLAEALLPLFTDLILLLTDHLKPIIEWLGDHEEFAELLFGIAAAITGTGGALLALGLLIKTLAMVRMALIATMSFMGPAGWTALGVGASVLAGMLIYGEVTSEKIPAPDTQKLLEPYLPKESAPAGEDAYTDIDSYAGGGFVGGPLGEPQLVEAHGGEYIGPVGGGNTTINIPVQYYMGDEASKRQLVRTIQDMMREEERRTAFSGINQGYFYGGSHI